MLSKFWKRSISFLLAITLFAQIIPLRSYADETLPAVVECDPQTGLSSLYEYSSVDIGKAGTAYLNTYLGTMHLRRSDLTLGGERMPVSIDFYYDPDNATQSNPYGSGWSSSFNQILTYDQSSSRYGYKDENGTWIYFTNSGTFTEDGDEIWVEDTQYGIGEVGMTLYLPADAAETSLTSVDLAYGDTHYAFDNSGRLTRINSGANQTLISYVSDTSNGISCVTDSVGRKFCFTYTDGYLSGIQCKTADDTVIPNTQVGYSVVDGYLTAVTYAADNVVSYGYDTSGRLISASGVDLCGYVFAYTESTDIVSSYTAKAGMGTAQETTGIQTTIQRDTDGSVTVTEDTSQTAYTFDTCGRVASWELRTLSAVAAADLTGAQYQCLYGYTLTYGYVTQDDGSVTHTVVDVQTYDADGVIEEETEPTEETTPEETTAPTEDPNAYAEDAYGNILTETYTAGGLKQTHSFTYSEDGNYLLSQTDENGNTVSYQYDLDSGLLEALTDANENTTEYSYNALRELQSVQLDVTGLQSATGMSAQYTYAQGRMTGLTYGGFQYGFTYDLWGNVTQVTVNGSSLVSYDYGTTAHKGQVQAMTYGNGQQVFYSYNALGQVETVGYTGQLNRFQYTYDTEGALSQVYDAILEETTVYTENGYTVYDAANAVVYSHVSGEDDSSTEVVGIYTVQSTAGEHSVSSTILRSGSSAGTVSASTAYDALQRVSANNYSIRGTEIAQYYSYATDASGNTGSLPESYTVTYTENDISYALNYQYQYDGNGNITSATETLYQWTDPASAEQTESSELYVSNGESSIPAGIWTKISEYTSTYGYDEAGQLVYATDTKTNRAYRYTYDASGNMKKKYVYDISSGEAAQISLTSYTYGTNGGLASSKQTGGNTAPINTTYQLDSMGNPISKTVGSTTSTYTWGEGRMLTGITTGSKNTTYTYNADGLRTSKTVTTGTSTSTTEYIWGSNGLAGVSQGLRKLLLLYDAEGSPIGFLMNGIAYTYVKNIQGDIIKILDNTGAAVVSYTYDPWGVPTATGNTIIAEINPCTYRGYDYDEDTGYFYLQSRYYDPTAGRFISPDNIAFLAVAEDPIEYNLFTYCVNNPTNRCDPTGYTPANVIGAIIGAIIGVVGGYLIARIIADKLGLKGWKRSVFISGLTAIITATATIIGYFLGPYFAKLTRAKVTSIKKALIHSACFVAGTLILTEQGYVPIENVDVGNMVYSTDPVSGETGFKTVLSLYTHETSHLIAVRINTELIVTTPSHPFWVIDTGWKQASTLSCGDRVLLANMEPGVVTSVEHVVLDTPVTVYNFEVQDWHTYHVGEIAVLVHNACSMNFKYKSPAQIAKLLDTTVDNFHKKIKPAILKKVGSKILKKIGYNPDIYLSADGTIQLVSTINKKMSFETCLNIFDFIK